MFKSSPAPDSQASTPSGDDGKLQEKSILEYCQEGNIYFLRQHCHDNAQSLYKSIQTPLDIYGNTPLHLCVSHQDLTLALLLLVKGADPNAPNKAGSTPTAIAKRLRLERLLKALQYHGGRIPPEMADPKRTTMAARPNLLKASEIIMKKKASPTDATFLKLPHNLPKSTLPVFDAAYLGAIPSSYTPTVKETMNPDLRGATALMKASFRGHAGVVSRLLDVVRTHKVDPDSMDGYGWTALTWACLSGALDVVTLLVEKGRANVNGNPKGLLRGAASPFMAACFGGHKPVVEYLISRNVNINARQGKGKGRSGVMIAAWMRHVELVKFLVKEGATIDSDVQNWLKSGVIAMKKMLVHNNIWMWMPGQAGGGGGDYGSLQRPNAGQQSSGANQTRRGLLQPTRTVMQKQHMVNKDDLKEKLWYLDTDENNLVQLLQSILSKNEATVQRFSTMDATDSGSSPGVLRINKANVDTITNVGIYTDLIKDMFHLFPDVGTELDFLSLGVTQCVVELILAAERNDKQQGVVLSAKAAANASSLAAAVSKLERYFVQSNKGAGAPATAAKPGEGTGQDPAETPTSPSTSPGAAAGPSLPPCMLALPLHPHIKTMTEEVRGEMSRQVLQTTRVAMGVWPPPTAVADMVKAASRLAMHCQTLVNIANMTGIWVRLPKQAVEVQIRTVSDNEPAAESTVEGDGEGTALDYEDYKRKNLLKNMEEEMLGGSSEDVAAAEDDPDVEFSRRLDNYIHEIVSLIRHLKVVRLAGKKKDYIPATLELCSKADQMVHDIQSFELFTDIEDDMDMSAEELEAIEEMTEVTIEVSESTIPLKDLVAFVIGEVHNTTMTVATRARKASQEPPPPGAADHMLSGCIPAILAVRNLIYIIRAIAGRLRQNASELRKKKDLWRKQCLQNDRVKNLLKQWGEGGSPEQDMGGDDAGHARLTEEDREMLAEKINGLVFDGGTLKGGRLTSMVEHMTAPSGANKLMGPDVEFAQAFLLTHHSFSTSIEVLDVLMRRYSITPPYGLSQAAFDFFIKKKLVPIRMRICNLVKAWLENHFEEDFYPNEAFTLKMRDFIVKKVLRDLPAVGQQLIKVLDKKLAQDPTLPPLDPIAIAAEKKINLPRAALPRFYNANSKEMNDFLFTEPRHLYEVDPLEMARQLTLVEFDYFRRLQSSEFLDQIWTNKRKRELESVNPDAKIPQGSLANPYLSSMIQHTNNFTMWIASHILNADSLQTRVAALKYFVQFAWQCKELKNFNGITGIVAALALSPVARLRKMWAGLERKHPKTNEMYKELAELVSPKQQYANYRKALREQTRPVVPFLGVFLTDLTFIELGNLDYLPESNFINFDKRRKVADLISNVRYYQTEPYLFQPVRGIQAFIKSLGVGKSVAGQPILDEDKLYNLSLVVEPREEEPDDDEFDGIEGEQ